MQKKIVFVSAIVFLSLVLVSCATLGLKSITEMTPEERGLFAMTLYTNAWDDYNLQYGGAEKPLSKQMESYFKSYKEVITTVRPIIDDYRKIVASGGTPLETQERELLLAIYSLQTVLRQKQNK
jgi:hypothetical protein